MEKISLNYYLYKIISGRNPESLDEVDLHQAHFNFDIDREGQHLSAQSSVSLVPGEQTVLFDKITQRGAFVGKAELLEVTVQEVSISLLVQEHCHDGGWRTIMSSVIHVGLGMPKLINLFNEQLDEFASLKLEITSV